MRSWLSLALTLSGIVALGAQSPEPTTLTPGVPVDAALTAGQTHTYDLELEAGDFAAFEIRKTLYLPIVAVTDPAGRKQLEGLAEVSIVADVTGRYLVEVRSNPRDAPPGPHQIVVESRRPATASDQARAAAARQLSEGRLIATAVTPAAARSAIEKYSLALSLFREAGHQLGEVLALYELGVSHSGLGDVVVAREHLTASATLARATGDTVREAHALLSLGASFRALTEQPRSLELYGQALRLYETLNDLRGQSRTLNNMASAFHELNEYQTALEHYDRALALANAVGDLAGVARIYTNRGRTLLSLGQVPDALESFNIALPLSQSTDNVELELAIINNTGIAYKQLGEYRRALDSYQQALAAFRRLDNAFAEAQVLNNMGNVYQNLGENDTALDHYNQALAIARRLQERGLEAMALNNMGTTFRHMGEYRRALDHHRQSREIRAAIGDRSGVASTLNQSGVAWHRLGDLEQAATSLRESLEIRRQLNEAVNEADTLLNLAAVERDRGDTATARTAIEAALTMTESLRASITDPNLRASYIARVEDTYAAHVDILMRLHQQSPAAGHDRAALQAAERSRARVLLESLVEARADLREGVDVTLLRQEQSSQQKLNAASGRLSQLLTRRSSDADVAAARKALETASADFVQVRSRIRASSPRYAALTQPEPLTAAEIQHSVLDDRTVLLEFALGDAKSWLFAVTPDAITSVPLPGRREIEAAARAVYGDVTARQPRAGETRAAAASRIAASDRALGDRSAAASQLLFGGISAQLNGPWRGKRLAIVATGALEYLPFAALPIPETGNAGTRATTPLVARHEIVTMPSVSVLATLRRETAGRAAPRRTLAVLADPVFELSDPRVTRNRPTPDPTATRSAVSPGDAAPEQPSLSSTRAIERLDAVRGGALTRLPFSREEATAITALARSEDTLEAVDFRASRATALDGSLADYRIVHFATHGLIDSERPELSGLVLSLVNDRGAAQDGFLRLSDIYNLRLNADLVVLSACQTALGREIRGEGLVGLTRGFMYAGAPRVVASLWQVNDLATADLMKKFYAGMLQHKLTPAAALRAAQLEMSKDPHWASPYYWAGFVMQGDWR